MIFWGKFMYHQNTSKYFHLTILGCLQWCIRILVVQKFWVGDMNLCFVRQIISKQNAEKLPWSAKLESCCLYYPDFRIWMFCCFSTYLPDLKSSNDLKLRSFHSVCGTAKFNWPGTWLHTVNLARQTPKTYFSGKLTNIWEQMGNNNKDLQDSNIFTTYFTLILELIAFLLWVFLKNMFLVFIWPHLDFCNKYKHCLYLFVFISIFYNY